MSEIPKRAAALVGALLFLITSAGLTIVVIWQAHQQSQQNSTQNTANTCQLGNGVQAETLPTPAPYKPPTTVTSLIQTDLSPGNGQVAQNGDCLNVKYYGTLASNGQKFDSNFDKPLTLKFPLGQGQVIPGWDQGLVGLKVGGTRQLVIPASQAYGSQATGSIPANSTLVFVVKLEKIGQ